MTLASAVASVLGQPSLGDQAGSTGTAGVCACGGGDAAMRRILVDFRRAQQRRDGEMLDRRQQQSCRDSGERGRGDDAHQHRGDSTGSSVAGKARGVSRIVRAVVDRFHLRKTGAVDEDEPEQDRADRRP